MNIAIEIPARRIADLMVTACEMNDMTASWCASVLPVPRSKMARYIATRPDKAYCWYDDPAIYDAGFLVDIVERSETEGKPDKTHRCNAAHLRRAFKLMAERYGEAFGEFMSENEDAITADAFLQCLALGEVVYG